MLSPAVDIFLLDTWTCSMSYVLSPAYTQNQEVMAEGKKFGAHCELAWLLRLLNSKLTRLGRLLLKARSLSHISDWGIFPGL